MSVEVSLLPRGSLFSRPPLRLEDLRGANFAAPQQEVDPLISRQRSEILQQMYGLASGFSPQDQSLINAAADVSAVCHANHLRRGDPPLHYMSHLLEVAKRVKENFRDFGETFKNPEGREISALAVTIVVALLHDSAEDIHKTFSANRSRSERFSAVEGFIEARLAEHIHRPGIQRIIEAISRLSIDNDFDIPTSAYVHAIEEDPLTLQVKQADISHNMLTMHEIAPISGVFTFAGQFAHLMSASPYADDFIRGICRCALKTKQSYDLSRPPQNGTEKRLAKFLQLDGELIGPRLTEFYANLLAVIPDKDEPRFIEEATNYALRRALGFHLESYAPIGSHSWETLMTPLKDVSVDGVLASLCGPIRGWSGELTAHCNHEQLEKAVAAAARNIGSRVSGFITSNDDGSLTFTTTRWPRRIGEAVPSCAHFAAALNEVKNVLSSWGVVASDRVNRNAGSDSYRVLLGLQEGYSEGCKNALLHRPDIRSGQELLQEFRRTIGEPENSGIARQLFEDLFEAKALLASINLTRVHSLSEVRERIGGSASIDTYPAQIFAADPILNLVYREPAALLLGAPGSGLPREALLLAYEMGQERFSIEWMRDIPECYSVHFRSV
ncbi:MAG: hypothetical protein J5J00_10785 [Deltaproteobacteria bacterium]|nr:hypothetical protein [Deltaproteobacteria bacterium]